MIGNIDCFEQYSTDFLFVHQYIIGPFNGPDHAIGMKHITDAQGHVLGDIGKGRIPVQGQVGLEHQADVDVIRDMGDPCAVKAAVTGGLGFGQDDLPVAQSVEMPNGITVGGLQGFEALDIEGGHCLTGGKGPRG